MPVYCYTHRDSDDNVTSLVERIYSVHDDRPKTIMHNGIRHTRDIRCEHGDYRQVCGNWPLKSDALGCHPDQIPEMQQAYAKQGVDVNFDKDTGQAILRDRSHRRDVMRVAGIHDRDAGYGDTYHG